MVDVHSRSAIGQAVTAVEPQEARCVEIEGRIEGLEAGLEAVNGELGDIDLDVDVEEAAKLLTSKNALLWLRKTFSARLQRHRDQQADLQTEVGRLQRLLDKTEQSLEGLDDPTTTWPEEVCDLQRIRLQVRCHWLRGDPGEDSEHIERARSARVGYDGRLSAAARTSLDELRTLEDQLAGR